MWLHCEKEPVTERESLQPDPAWPCSESLRTIAELNEQCLELLAEQAMLRHPAAPPMLRELADVWSHFDANARRRAAACPYLLLDAGFADPLRWRWLGTHRVGDREPTKLTPFFTVPGVIRVAHQVFNNAWYMVRSHLPSAPLFLGMPVPCAMLLRACTLRQLMELAEFHTSWLRPRWAGRLRIWHELLSAAISGDIPALERARLHGVQLLATELRSFDHGVPPNRSERDVRV